MQFHTVPKGAAVQFLWDDHASTSGWLYADVAGSLGAMRIASIGHVVKSNRKTLTITGSWDLKQDRVSEPLTVIWSCVHDFRVLPKRYWVKP